MADQPTEKPDTAPPDATAQETPTTAPETSETELASKDQPKPAAEAPKDESKNPDGKFRLRSQCTICARCLQAVGLKHQLAAALEILT